MFKKTLVKTPNHIAIIMDGNGRWAAKRGLPRSAGHRKGIKNVERILKAARDLDTGIITFFCFSTENWNRPKREVDMLMRSFCNYLKDYRDKLNKDNIQLRVIGRLRGLPENLLSEIQETTKLTSSNDGLIVNLAINYGGRAELVDAVKSIAKEVKNGNLRPEAINDESIKDNLYTHDLPDPDLLIRTSGEMRISNFLPWQLSYAELVFVKKHWPSFGPRDLEECVQEYKKRHRRFGGL